MWLGCLNGRLEFVAELLEALTIDGQRLAVFAGQFFDECLSQIVHESITRWTVSLCGRDSSSVARISRTELDGSTNFEGVRLYVSRTNEVRRLHRPCLAERSSIVRLS
ncbi:hypothetical protein HAPAU_33260 [Halalkalicoccus paucihalophilus]|uniref:Uncharacterized protein n=1 Tax=Halalkalicoccus paucihalophilus TaxID=1008153 RepID=A0A151A9R0_9EURY|nr:hypothetical protein HAPAU_33260 [Halalkalicoccus paucihalophilus]